MKKCAVILAVLGLVLSTGAMTGDAFAGNDEKGARFAGCDKNSDGFLDQPEFATCFPKRADKFAEVDVNKDGKVNKDEIKAYHVGKKNARFDAIDTDKDGKLSKEELNAHRAANKDAKKSEKPTKGAIQ